MLLNVHVKNLALIEESEVYFKEGLNILTGETGAGKSIIIGSINIALGNKLPKAIVRDGAEYGLAELVFVSGSKEVMKKMAEEDIPYEEDGQIIVSRKIINGRSIMKVNGKAVALSTVKELTALLIDIHGQHDSELLMNKSRHMDILDEYGLNDISDLKEKVAFLYEKYKQCKSELENFEMDEEEKNKEEAFLQFQINEIEEADLKLKEDDELEEEFKRMSHSKKIVEALNVVYALTSAGMDNSFSEAVGYAIKEISSVMNLDEKMQVFYDSLMDIDSICSDLSREVSDYMDELTFDEERINYVSERLNLINKLKMKYGQSIEMILDKLESLKERYEMLRNISENIQKLKEQSDAIEKELRISSEELSKARKVMAQAFENDIKKELTELNFLEVNFNVNFGNAGTYTAKGTDIIEFYISTNSGEKVKPLSEVASGGELSRIMLALKSLMAGKDGIDTLIFDEIDTGISGRTAQMVSEKMKKISKNHQVMAITHLPQIAAMADNHYLIEKSVKNGKTVTEIRWLQEDEAVMEIARILGGVEITDAVIENAKEMKNMAKLTK